MLPNNALVKIKKKVENVFVLKLKVCEFERVQVLRFEVFFIKGTVIFFTFVTVQRANDILGVLFQASLSNNNKTKLNKGRLEKVENLTTKNVK